MAGLRRVVELTKAQFRRAVNWLRPVKIEALRRIDPPLENEEIAEGGAARQSKAARVSLTQEKLLWYASSFKSNFTETNEVGLAHLPPAKGLLNLVDILCKDTSQSNQV
jgi:hypothetical protein